MSYRVPNRKKTIKGNKPKQFSDYTPEKKNQFSSYNKEQDFADKKRGSGIKQSIEGAYLEIFDWVKKQEFRKKFFNLYTDIKKLKLTKTYIHTLIRKNKVALGILAGILIIIIFVGMWLLSGDDNSNTTYSVSKEVLSQVEAKNDKTLPREKPKFKIMFPDGDEKNIIGDIVRVTPEGREPAYRYYDEIDSVVISVSQQQIPESLKNNLEVEINKMATSFQATNVIKVDNMIVYHGTKEKTNEQSLIFVKNNLMVFIVSEKVLYDSQWVSYIVSLK